MRIRLWAVLALLLATTPAHGQMSIGSVRASVESMNLEVVTLHRPLRICVEATDIQHLAP